MLRDLIAAFAAYDADATQRCLVLTGSEYWVLMVNAEDRHYEPAIWIPSIASYRNTFAEIISCGE